jgi:hypothetical protein
MLNTKFNSINTDMYDQMPHVTRRFFLNQSVVDNYRVVLRKITDDGKKAKPLSEF